MKGGKFRRFGGEWLGHFARYGDSKAIQAIGVGSRLGDQAFGLGYPG